MFRISVVMPLKGQEVRFCQPGGFGECLPGELQRLLEVLFTHNIHLVQDKHKLMDILLNVAQVVHLGLSQQRVHRHYKNAGVRPYAR